MAAMQVGKGRTTREGNNLFSLRKRVVVETRNIESRLLTEAGKELYKSNSDKEDGDHIVLSFLNELHCL